MRVRWRTGAMMNPRASRAEFKLRPKEGVGIRRGDIATWCVCGCIIGYIAARELDLEGWGEGREVA